MRVFSRGASSLLILLAAQRALLVAAAPTDSHEIQERSPGLFGNQQGENEGENDDDDSHGGGLLKSLSGLDLPNLGALVNSTLTTLDSLIQALLAGTTVQNGLYHVLNTNNATLAAGANTTNTTNTLATGTGTTTNNSCPDLAVIFARGTSEPGNVGFLTGPPFITALQNYANTTRVAMQGVDYWASVGGFEVGGDPFGANLMAHLTNVTMAACPQTKLVLSGYSQGAQVVHKACAMLPNSTTAALSSVVLFGDPRNGTAVQGVDAGRTLVICHAGDNICQGGAAVLPAHLNYSSDAPTAAMFVMQKSGLGMASGDAVMQGMGNIPMMSTPTASSTNAVAAAIQKALGGR